MNALLRALREDLAARTNPRNQEGAQRFFKESIRSYGIRMADVRLLAREYFRELKASTKEEVFALCEALWASGMMEEAHIAAFWTQALRKQFTESDIETFARWIDTYVSNWAACDNFCNNTLGAYFEKFPQQVPVLQQWARSANRWMRRASAAALIAPARKGRFLEESLAIATLLLRDPDDLVQKAYGWLLKEQCKKNEPAVYDFIHAHRQEMPRTALRYAIEKMPAADRVLLMGKQ
ncbi:MAG: DNA alkylation repair protein [Chitinophagaceae bacterium]|nr:MAG: DNA alkylation repair protein [Chitinophagaceae bacterium]